MKALSKTFALLAPLFALGAIVISSLSLVTCGDSATDPADEAPQISQSWYQSCDHRSARMAAASGAIDDCDEVLLLEWRKDSTLRVLHVNAPVNCCGELTNPLLVVGDSTVLITERERYSHDQAPCRCLCLCSVEYEITGLDQRSYLVTVKALNLPESDEPISLLVAYGEDSERVIQRTQYPWCSGGQEVDLVSVSECLQTFPLPDFPPLGVENPCIDYSLSGDGVLTLTFTNILMSCCLDSLQIAASSLGTDSLQVLFYPHGPECDCVCTRDFTVTLTKVLPRAMWLSLAEIWFVSPGEQLTYLPWVAANLSTDTSGSYCYSSLRGTVR